MRVGHAAPQRLTAVAAAVIVVAVLVAVVANGHHRVGGPAEPTGVSAVAYAEGRVLVAWAPGRGAPGDTYLLTWSVGPGVAGRQTATGSDAMISGLVVGARYRFTVAASDQAGTSAPARTAPVAVVGAVAPPAPAAVRLSADGADNRLTVSWPAPAGSPAPDVYVITVFEARAPQAATDVGTVDCFAPCRAQTLDADPGTVAAVAVQASGPAGGSVPVPSAPVVVPQPCAGACLSVDADAPGPPEDHPAAGFLHAIGAATSPVAVRGVAPTQWRVSSGSPPPAQVGASEDATAARVSNADLTELLSDDWVTTHHLATGPDRGFAVPPWSDPAVYQAWVTAEVRSIETQGRAHGFRIRYWEVQNEPFEAGYYSPQAPALASARGGAGETVADFEVQYAAAYRGIRAADPGAAIVAPSLAAWSAGPAQAAAEAPGNLDMRTFLDFATRSGLVPDAIAWHENATLPRPDQFSAGGGPEQPDGIAADVAQARGLIASRPSLGHPALLVNEYGDPLLSASPGWDVGRIAALEAAGVTGANRSCFGTCGVGSLDGLLAGNGSTPLAGWWVYAFYAAMTGRLAPVTTTYTDVTGLATVDAARQVRVLVGRHQGCGISSSLAAASCAPEPVTLRVDVPFGDGAAVTEAVIPEVPGPLPAPVVGGSKAVPVVDGAVTVTTPPITDGAAVAVTVGPA